MNKIIPFNKDITFNEPIGEIISIALDDTLKFDGPLCIKGELIIRGCNKRNEITEDFSYPLPVEIAVDDKYDTEKASISIDDFYYEIINDNILRVKIDLILDDLYYKEVEVPKENRKIDFDLDINKDDDNLSGEIELLKDDKEMMKATIEKEGDDKLSASIDIDKNKKNDDVSEDVMDLFKENADDKEYSIYRVYVVKDDDTLDAILNKYKVTREDLEKYNDLSSVKPGVKLIIPSVDE